MEGQIFRMCNKFLKSWIKIYDFWNLLHWFWIENQFYFLTIVLRWNFLNSYDTPSKYKLNCAQVDYISNTYTYLFIHTLWMVFSKKTNIARVGYLISWFISLRCSEQNWASFCFCVAFTCSTLPTSSSVCLRHASTWFSIFFLNIKATTHESHPLGEHGVFSSKVLRYVHFLVQLCFNCRAYDIAKCACAPWIKLSNKQCSGKSQTFFDQLFESPCWRRFFLNENASNSAICAF